MEEEARQLLKQGLKAASEIQPVRLTSLATTLFGPTHGLDDLELPLRDAPRPLADWAK